MGKQKREGRLLLGLLRGLGTIIPEILSCIATNSDEAASERVAAAFSEFLGHVGQGERARIESLLRLTPHDMEVAAEEMGGRLREPEKCRLIQAFQSLPSPETDEAIPLRLERLIAVLANMPSMRHALRARSQETITRTPVLDVGRTISARYEILEFVGAGGMGAVYRARDGDLDDEVAIKFLHPKRAQDAGVAKWFMREAKVGLRLTHENIVRVRDVGKHEGAPFITMEWIEGQTLRARLDDSDRMSWESTEIVVRSLLTGLAHAHRMGVLHLDVKPENVLVLPDGSAKLCDFGLARMAARPLSTVAHLGAGTPRYMSPEQEQGDEPDKRSDVYSAAVVAFEMLSGKLPRGRYRPLPEDVPAHVRHAVMRALSHDRAERHPDADAFLEELSAPRPSEVRPGSTTATGLATRRPQGLSFPPDQLLHLGTNPQGFEEYRWEKDGSVLVLVPPTEFMMGFDGNKTASPQHRVSLSPFFIGKFEITNLQYRRFCQDTRTRRPSALYPGFGYKNYYVDSRYDEHPVVCVNWHEARAYCLWTGLDLPTEAQWECAARGRDGRPFPWGSASPDFLKAALPAFQWVTG